MSTAIKRKAPLAAAAAAPAPVRRKAPLAVVEAPQPVAPAGADYIASDREMAMIQGAKFYHGPQCEEGHTVRYSSTTECVECKRDAYERRRDDAPRRERARQTAIDAGHTHYRAARPCKFGHEPIRYASNGHCVACALDISRDRRNHRDTAAKLSVRSQIKYWQEEQAAAMRRARECKEKIEELKRVGE